MTGGSRVLVALRVPATAERAFTAFTEEIGQWWRPDGLFRFTPGRTGTLAFEPGPGGRLVETYADGSSFVVGHVRAWEPPHRLVVSWRHAGFTPDQETELHVRFDEVGEAGEVGDEAGGTGGGPAPGADAGAGADGSGDAGAAGARGRGGRAGAGQAADAANGAGAARVRGGDAGGAAGEAPTRRAVQTRVTVEHYGWDAIPPEHAARHGFPLPTFQLRFAEWWQALLRSLAEVTGDPPPGAGPPGRPGG